MSNKSATEHQNNNADILLSPRCDGLQNLMTGLPIDGTVVLTNSTAQLLLFCIVYAALV